MQTNIKRSIMLCTLAIGLTSASLAVADQDIVVGPGKQPVRNERFGTCVQTKWNSSSNPCVEQAPAPVQAQIAPHRHQGIQAVSRLAREQLTIYFDFNKSALTADSKRKLDAIANAVKSSPRVTKVNIVGYTDEIGGDEYNNKLSVARADAVKAYLDKKIAIDVNVLGLRGLGKADPVVDCAKVKSRKKKIACMAKDRRVEIEFEFQK